VSDPAVPIDRYAAAERQMAQALGLDLADLSPDEALRLTTACALRLELDRLELLSRAGQAIDPAALIKASEALRDMLAPEEDAGLGYDVSRLTSSEAEELEALLSRALGQSDTPLHDEVTPLAAEVESHQRTRAELGCEREAHKRSKAGYSHVWQEMTDARAELTKAHEELGIVRKLNGLQAELLLAYSEFVPQHLRAKPEVPSNVVLLKPSGAAG